MQQWRLELNLEHVIMLLREGWRLC